MFRWTADKMELLRFLFIKEASLEFMATSLGADEKEVRLKIVRMGLKRASERARPQASPWTPEREKQLAELWNVEGKSASQIARIIGNGVTRGGVIGKARRMGLAVRKEPKGRTVQSAAVVPLDTSGPKLRKVAKAPLPKAPTTDIARKTLADLESHDCRWPVGDPMKSNFGFCAAERVPGKPYCAEHL